MLLQAIELYLIAVTLGNRMPLGEPPVFEVLFASHVVPIFPIRACIARSPFVNEGDMVMLVSH